MFPLVGITTRMVASKAFGREKTERTKNKRPGPEFFKVVMFVKTEYAAYR